jgi:hypothetical protein
MDKKPLIGVSILAMVLLVLGSLSNVVGFQTVQSSNQQIINEEVNQRELLFQTIVDIANNKEIQRIILKSQISRGIFPTSEFLVVTKNQLKMMYFIGLILSKVVSKSRIHTMIKQNHFNDKGMQREIAAVIEQNATIKAEITLVQSSECNCEKESTTDFYFPVLCQILAYLFIFIGIFPYVFFPIWGSALIIAILLNCPWTQP